MAAPRRPVIRDAGQPVAQAPVRAVISGKDAGQLADVNVDQGR